MPVAPARHPLAHFGLRPSALPFRRASDRFAPDRFGPDRHGEAQLGYRPTQKYIEGGDGEQKTIDPVKNTPMAG